jgi:hypothetical protein
MGRAKQTVGVANFNNVLGSRRGSNRQIPSTITVTNGAGAGPAASRTFTFLVIRRGDYYGHKRCKLHEDERPLICAFDATYAGQEGFDELGQLTGGTYYLKTLLESSRDDGAITPLNLHGGVPEWTVDEAAMREVNAWLAQL